MSLRRSLITNSYLYDLLLFVQPSTTTLSLFIPHEIPTKSESRDQSHPWPWGKGSLSLSLSIFSVGLQISFLCRLIKLAWHISDFYHLISPPSVHLSPFSSFSRFVLFYFILFLSFLRYFLRRLYTSILSVSLFPPSYSSFLCVFTYRYVSVFVHVHLRCYATVLVHGGTSIPFGTFLDHVEVILLYHADWEWIRIPFESWYPFVADVSRRKIDFSREGREREKKICRYHKERKENVSSIVLDFFFHTRYNNHFYIFYD